MTSKGRCCILHGQCEFVKHRQYANGSIQWRCKLYQKSKCPARITTRADTVVGRSGPEHNHGSNVEAALWRQAVAVMKNMMTSKVSATPASVVRAVTVSLDSDVLLALPKRASLERTLQRSKHRELRQDRNVYSWLFIAYSYSLLYMRAPNLLLNQGPADPCYATGHATTYLDHSKNYQHQCQLLCSFVARSSDCFSFVAFST